VFGAGFNNGGGFAAFSGATAAAPKADEGAAAGDEPEVEEECKAEFTPLVQLEEVEKTTGEENEDCLLELCAAILHCGLVKL
jgi:Ran-binding protein 1